MAVNRKGGNAIVALLLAHGEKGAIALALLLAGWLVYGSLNYDAIDDKPESLGQLANAARQKVDNFTWRDALDVEEGARLAEGFRPVPSMEVVSGFYEGDNKGLNPSVLPRTVFRPDPPLLAAASLTVSAGTELMGFEDEGYSRNKQLEDLKEEKRKQQQREKERRLEKEGRGPAQRDADEPIRVTGPRNGVSLDDGDKAEIVSYAIVLAKVPVQEQIDLFRSVLKDASGFDKSDDQPRYLGYYVERRTVSPGSVGEWGKVFLRNSYNNERLDAVDVNTIAITSLDWVEDLEEVADDDYLDDSFTFPLPPLVGRDWGPEVVHPEVPLQVEADLEENETERENPLNRSRGGGRDNVGFARFGARGVDALDAETGVLEEDVELIYPKPFMMLRFFDMTVRPGQQYQYRVRLVVRDPNASIDRQILAKDVLERMSKEGEDLEPDERFRLTPWSEASPVTSIPQAGGVLLSTVEPARRPFNTEPTVQLVVNTFGALEGETVPSLTRRKFQRGGVANFRGIDVPVIIDRELKTVEEFNYRTDITLLDIFGGGPLTRETALPAAILVMDASGRMSIHTELDDARDAQTRLDRYSGKENDGRGRSSSPSDTGFNEESF